MPVRVLALMETMKHCSNNLSPVKCVSSTLPLIIALSMSRPAQLCSVSVLLIPVKPPLLMSLLLIAKAR
eukprot:3192938-Heterocapsa_arctica.AAC.1